MLEESPDPVLQLYCWIAEVIILALWFAATVIFIGTLTIRWFYRQVKKLKERRTA